MWIYFKTLKLQRFSFYINFSTKHLDLSGVQSCIVSFRVTYQYWPVAGGHGGSAACALVDARLLQSVEQSTGLNRLEAACMVLIGHLEGRPQQQV